MKHENEDNDTIYLAGLMTPDEVASRFQVCRRTILKWAREGKLSHERFSRKVVRFTVESVIAFENASLSDINKNIGLMQVETQHDKRTEIESKGGKLSSRKSSWRSLREEVTKCQSD